MFDLEKFKAGALAVDRLGRKWRYVRPASHVWLTGYDIVALDIDNDIPNAFLRSGHYWEDKRYSVHDLVSMAPVESSAPAPAPQTTDKKPRFVPGMKVRYKDNPDQIREVFGYSPRKRGGELVLFDATGTWLHVVSAEACEPVPEEEEKTLYLNVYAGELISSAYASERAANVHASSARLTGKAIPVTIKVPKQ